MQTKGKFHTLLSENVSAFNFNTFNFEVTSGIIHDPEIFSKEKTKYIINLKLNSVFNLTYSKMYFCYIQFYEVLHALIYVSNKIVSTIKIQPSSLSCYLSVVTPSLHLYPWKPLIYSLSL